MEVGYKRTDITRAERTTVRFLFLLHPLNSGAVSGILGAYLLLFPHARVHTLIFIFFYVHVIRLPALFVIGFWIVIQFINGILSKGVATQGGVAWFAHIGGFVFGILVIKIFLKTKRRYF